MWMLPRFALSVGLMLVIPALAFGVEVSNAKLRVLPGPAPAAGYLSLRNQASESATLVGAETSAFARVELHRSIRDEDGMSRMIKLDEILVPAGETVALVPGGLHLMFMQRQADLVAGDTADVILHWQDRPSSPVVFEVVPATYRGEME